MSLLERFDRAPGESNPNLLVRGAILLAVFGAIMTVLYSRGIPFWPKSGEVVKAQFASAANVSPGKTPVRVHGVQVGEVDKVERRPDGRGVIVTMRLKDTHGFRITRDARAHILWRTLMGFNFYIELEPGSPSAAALGDGTIPVSNTTTQVELDQVLASVTPPSRAGIRTMLQEFDRGFSHPRPIERTLKVLAPTMRSIAPGVSALRGSKPGDLTETVRNTSRLLGALGRSEVDLGNLVGNADTTLGVTAARRADLGRILQDGPATLRQTQATLRRLRTTLDVLDPISEQLRPGVRRLDEASRSLRPALAHLRPLLTDARPLLRDLRPALARLQGAARQGTPLLAGLMPTLKRTNDVLIPWADTKDANTNLKNFEAIGPVFATVSSSASLFDTYSYIQRFGAGNAVSERTPAFLPCTTYVVQQKRANCEDVDKVIKRLLGAGAGKGSR
jgi:phospholipid/cholesterol/gamma-HCH transport system substrate-binding protein